MTDQKAYFQNVSNQMEDLLRQYKQSYPLNYGDMLRNVLPIAPIIIPIFLIPFEQRADILSIIRPIIIIIGMIMFVIHYYKKFDKFNEYILFMFLVAVFMFYPLFTGTIISEIELILFIILVILGAILLILNRKDSKQIKIILLNIAQQKELLKPYSHYSDVNDYLTRYDKILDKTKSEKKQITTRYRIVIISILAIGLGLYVLQKVKDRQKAEQPLSEYSNSDENSYSDLEKILDIHEQEIFLTLSPLSEHIENGNSDEMYHNQIEVSCDYSAPRLNIPQIYTENTDTAALYYLIITNQDGSTIPDCPKFYFRGDNQSSIHSEFFNFSRKYLHYSYTDLEFLTLMLYLKNHKDSLRYKIEKVE